MAFCKNCGNEYRAGAKFCRSCGNALPVRKAEPVRKTLDAPVSRSHSDTSSAPPPRIAPVKPPLAPVDPVALTRRLKTMAVVGALLIVIVGGYAAYPTVSNVLAQRRINAQAQSAQANQQNAITLPNTPPPQFEKGKADIEDAVDKNTGLEMVAISGGTFSMGSVENSDEQPIRQISIDGFSMSKNLVTVAQYEEYCNSVGKNVPRTVGMFSTPQVKNHPIQNITWDDAIAYCQWLSTRGEKMYDLPTEAEWEYAARGGLESKKYPWGDAWDASKCANSVSPNALRGTVAVGVYSANGYGLNDMAGNVWQWCRDWYQRYPANLEDNSHLRSGSGFIQVGRRRVLRGGCWRDSNPDSFRVAKRYYDNPTDLALIAGFRVVYHQPSAEHEPVGSTTPTGDQDAKTPNVESKPRPTETQSSVPPQPGVSGAGAVAAYIVAMGSQRYLSDSDLAGKSAWELTVMRNAPYAKHGYLFGNARLRALFSKETWYRSETDNMSLIESRLSAIEKKNVAFISAYQEKNHLKLNLKALP